MDDINIIAITGIGVVIVFAGIFRGLTGFGGPLILIPIFIQIFPAATAVSTVLIADIISNIWILKGAIAKCCRRTSSITIIGAVVGLPIGSIIILYMDGNLVNSFIYMVCGVASYMIIRKIQPNRLLKGYELFLGGNVSGAIMGATGLGIGIVPVMSASTRDPTVVRANLIVFVAVCSVILLGIMVSRNVIDLTNAWIPALVAGLYIPSVIVGALVVSWVNHGILRVVIGVGLSVLSLIGFSYSMFSYIFG